jgi:hypothetical protein
MSTAMLSGTKEDDEVPPRWENQFNFHFKVLFNNQNLKQQFKTYYLIEFSNAIYRYFKNRYEQMLSD